MFADPVPGYLGRGVNDHKNAEVRNVLEPFFDMLKELGVAFLGNTHFGKATDQRTSVDRILGSVGYVNLARVVWVTVRDPEDPEKRYLCQPKNNYSPDQPALVYRITGQDVEDGETIRTSRVEFEAEPVEADPDELMAASRKGKGRRGPSPKKTLAVAEWLFDVLSDAPQPTPLAEIFDAAGSKGFVGQKRESNGKWSIPAALYQARDLVPTLPAPRHGKKVFDLKAPVRDGHREVVHWYLGSADAAF
jgi:hypothetical protein